MSNRQVDRYLEQEHYHDEVACCECGFHRNGAHHPKIKCPKTGRCGECGNPWPCTDHVPPKNTKEEGTAMKRKTLKYQISFTIEVDAHPEADVAEMVTKIWDGEEEKDRKVFLDSYDFQATLLED